MSKPTEFSRWATTGGADVTEPASGTKDTGYVDGGVPDAGELNWLLNRDYLWQVWLDAFESTAHAWTAVQTFSRGVTANAYPATSRPGITANAVSGFPGALSQGETLTPGILAYTSGIGSAPAADFVIPWGGAVSGIPIRAYIEDSPGGSGILGPPSTTHTGILMRIYGRAQFDAGAIGTAKSTFPGFDGTGLTTVPAMRGLASNSANAVGISAEISDTADATGRALKVFKRTAGSPTVPDLSNTGVLAEIAGALQFTGANPAKTAALPNSICALNVIKAGATITFNNTVSPTWDGVGITSITQHASNGLVTVTFATAFASANYVAIGMSPDSSSTSKTQILCDGTAGNGQKAAGVYTFTIAQDGTVGGLNTANCNNRVVDLIFLGR